MASGDLEHALAQRGDQQGHGGLAGNIQPEFDPVFLAAKRDPLTMEKRPQDLHVFQHMAGPAPVGESQQIFDYRGMRKADAQGEAPAASGRGGQGLLGQRCGMARIRRHHRRPDLDSIRGLADHGCSHQGIEAEDAGQPERIEAPGLEVPGSPGQFAQWRRSARPSQHDADSHSGPLPPRPV